MRKLQKICIFIKLDCRIDYRGSPLKQRFMKLMTRVELSEFPFRISHRDPIFMMGSCFTDNIGTLLERYRFPVTVNPFGTLFNPVSVKTGMESLLEKEQYTPQDVGEYNGSWFSFDHYTGFSSTSREKCLDGINREFFRARKKLDDAKVLILSWGTAWIFTEHATGRVVSNCHKIPADRFRRSRLDVQGITEVYKPLFEKLLRVNPHMKIILTVSPVRHWKDGARENQLSKSVLLLATRELEKIFPENVFYFPSYEIVMDELRDYRFYAGDMLHMSDQASQYIWEIFSDAMVSDESKQIIRDLEPFVKLLNHRPWDTGKAALAKLEEKRTQWEKELIQKYPFIDF